MWQFNYSKSITLTVTRSDACGNILRAADANVFENLSHLNFTRHWAADKIHRTYALVPKYKIRFIKADIGEYNGT